MTQQIEPQPDPADAPRARRIVYHARPGSSVLLLALGTVPRASTTTVPITTIEDIQAAKPTTTP
jgi:hypothetical protein